MREVLEFAYVGGHVVNITVINEGVVEVIVDCTVYKPVGTKSISISKDGTVLSVDVDDVRSVTFKARP